MDIPDIAFTPQTINGDDFDIFELASLNQRRAQLRHDPAAPHRVDFYLLIYIERGCGSHFIDFNHYPFQPSSFLFVNKNQINAFDFSDQVDGKVMLFTDRFISNTQSSMRLPLFSPSHLDDGYSPLLNASESLTQSCDSLLREIVNENHRQDCNRLIIMSLFSSLLLMLSRERPQLRSERLSDSQRDRFTRFIRLLEANFSRSRDASNYARQLHITYKTLNQLCKLASRQTAKQLIDAFTILEAKRRLVLEPMPIQQLADELGFDEPSNFVKYFKKHCAMTPTEFRKKTKG